ncbi:MAG: hypothetical protein WCP12_16760, partial [bacterium]
ANIYELGVIARDILLQKSVNDVNLGAAYQIASVGNDLAVSRNPFVLHWLARASFMKGEQKKAVELETKALRLETDENTQKEYQSTLKSYQQGQLPDLSAAIEQAEQYKLWQDFWVALAAERWDVAEILRNRIIKQGAQGKAVNPAPGTDDWKRAELLAMAGMAIGLGKGDRVSAENTAIEFAKRIARDKRQESSILKQFAWALLSEKNVGKIGVEAASNLALRSSDLSGGRNTDVLHVLARAAFMKGDHRNAVELETKALKLADNPVDTKEYQSALEGFQRGLLPDSSAEPRIMRLRNKLRLALEEKQWDTAEVLMNKVQEENEGVRLFDPSSPSIQEESARIRIEIYLGKGDLKAAENTVQELARSAAGGNQERAKCVLNSIVRSYLSEEHPGDKKLGFAYELARRANEGPLRGRCRAEHLGTLALATFRKGDRQQAIELVQKALSCCEDAKTKTLLESELDRFKSKEASAEQSSMRTTPK